MKFNYRILNIHHRVESFVKIVIFISFRDEISTWLATKEIIFYDSLIKKKKSGIKRRVQNSNNYA